MRRFMVGVLLLAFCWVGCSKDSSKNSNLPDTYPVSGVVVMNGEPVANAIVNFQLKGGTRGATGTTDTKGEFVLMTFSPGDGAVPGEYQVSVVKYSTPPADYPPPPEEYDPKYVPFKAENLLPKKYSRHDSSGLTSVVNPGKNQIELKLSK